MAGRKDTYKLQYLRMKTTQKMFNNWLNVESAAESDVTSSATQKSVVQQLTLHLGV